MAEGQDSITTRLDFNPLYTSSRTVLTAPVVNTLPPVQHLVPNAIINTNLIYDPVLNQHVFAQSFSNSHIITAPVLQQARQSVKWLIEHVPTSSLAMRGSKILARRNKDGYYYPATIHRVNPDLEGTFMVQFDKVSKKKIKKQKTSWYDMISIDDALTHSIQTGDYIMAPFEQNGVRYAPGKVLDGQDLERFGAVLRNQGSGYENDPHLFVKFGRNVTKVVRASKCIWIPDVLYERLWSEIGRPGKREEAVNMNASARNLGLVSYSDVPVVPLPNFGSLYNFPVWNNLSPILYNGGTYIPTYPYLWHQSLWPHMVTVQEPVQVPVQQPVEIPPIAEPKSEKVKQPDLEQTDKLLAKIHIDCSDDELDEFSKLKLDETDNEELATWRAQRKLKEEAKQKLNESGMQLVSASSSSDSSSEDEDSGYKSRKSTSRSIRPLSARPDRQRLIETVDTGVQINAQPRQVLSARKFRPHTKAYSRKRVVEKPPWVKYWKQNSRNSNKTLMQMATVGYMDPHRMDPAGGSGRPLTQEEKLYSLEQNTAQMMRRTHDKLSQEERQKVRLQQARERRVIDRLNNDLKRELGNSMPGASVFTFNNKGDTFKFTQPGPAEAYTQGTQAGDIAGVGTQTMPARNAGGNTTSPSSMPKTYNIGNQTFVERNVAVQVDP